MPAAFRLGRTLELDIGAASRRIVLENDIVFGSVNANRAHYETAATAIDTADHDWLARLVTRRVPVESWTEGLDRRVDDVKVVIQVSPTMTNAGVPVA